MNRTKLPPLARCAAFDALGHAEYRGAPAPGNAENGIYLEGIGSNGNIIRGNYVGLRCARTQ